MKAATGRMILKISLIDDICGTYRLQGIHTEDYSKVPRITDYVPTPRSEEVSWTMTVKRQNELLEGNNLRISITDGEESITGSCSEIEVNALTLDGKFYGTATGMNWNGATGQGTTHLSYKGEMNFYYVEITNGGYISVGLDARGSIREYLPADVISLTGEKISD